MLFSIAAGVRTAVIAALGTALIGGRVYYQLAAERAALPYVVTGEAGGGSTNDTPRDAFDVFWQVDAVSEDGATAMQIGDALREGLHNAALDLGTVWKHLDCQHESPAFIVETVEKRQYYHAVNTFRIRATK